MSLALATPKGVRHASIRLCRDLLRKSAQRSLHKRFLVEGVREIQCAHQHHWHIESVFVSEHAQKELLTQLPAVTTHLCTPKAFAMISYRDHAANAVALAHMRGLGLEQLNINTHDPRPIVILVGTEKPGNLGAIIRTALLADAQGLVLVDAPIDPYHPNVVRNSLGGIFGLKIAVGQSQETQNWLKEHAIPCIGLSPQAKTPLYAQALEHCHAWVLGNEQSGLPQAWAKHCTHNVYIPMRQYTGVDSLNLSNSAALALYEALRQRNHAINP